MPKIGFSEGLSWKLYCLHYFYRDENATSSVERAFFFCSSKYFFGATHQFLVRLHLCNRTSQNETESIVSGANCFFLQEVLST